MEPKIGIEIILKKDFNIVREILERIGIANKEKKEIYPSCNILHKKGKYYIVHFKELFSLDNKESNMTEKDYRRRDSVVYLLNKWELLDPVDIDPEELRTNEFFFILKKEERDNGWSIVPKYKIGNKGNQIVQEQNYNLKNGFGSK